jgi:hypothetical protein
LPLADLEHGERCGGPMRWVEAPTSPEAISRLLAKHGLAARPACSDGSPRATRTAALCLPALTCFRPVLAPHHREPSAISAARSRLILAPLLTDSPTEPLAHRQALPPALRYGFRLARCTALSQFVWTWALLRTRTSAHSSAYQSRGRPRRAER